jgi:hypothetical protein
MSTLIAAYNSDGCIGRCDDKCHNAKHPVCNCICKGLNHGVGYAQAIANTVKLVDKTLEEYRLQNPDHKIIKKMRNITKEQALLCKQKKCSYMVESSGTYLCGFDDLNCKDTIKKRKAIKVITNPDIRSKQLTIFDELNRKDNDT